MPSIPQNIDPNKIFLVNFSELEGRWDPTFAIYNKNINHYAFPIVRLQDLIAQKPQYGTAESGIPRISELAPRYIRITDIDELGNLEDGLGATAENVEMQYILNENDILFARSGATVGKAYLHKNQPYVCFFAGYMIRFVVDNTKILPQYLFIYTQLKPYKDWVRAIQRAAAQPNINAEEYKSLPISLPPLHIQQQIVNVYNAALSQRKKKLSESKAKLASIDQYLLGELGITLPEDSHEKTFIVNYKDVDGGRLDPNFYRLEYSSLVSNLRESDFCKVKDVVVFSDEMWNQESLFSDYFPYLEISGINLEYGQIEAIILTRKKDAPSRARMILREGDLIVSLTRPMRGAIALFDIADHNVAIGSTGFSVIRDVDSKRISKDYLCIVLKSSIVLKQFAQRCSGGNYPAITQYDLGCVSIPLPSLDKQQEIADHISAIRAEAKALEQDANTILEQVKKEVEKMILGYFS